MKKIVLILFVAYQIQARIFFVGSNPFLSSIAFPQDILMFPGEAVYMWPSYQQLPWWGDIDQPDKKPSDSYATTEEAVTFNDRREFEQDAAIHNFSNRKGLTLHINDKLMNYTLFETAIISMVNEASGSLRADNINPLPFEYKLNHVLGKLYFQPIFAFKFKDIPIGIKGGIGFINTISLKNKFEYTLNGSKQKSDAIAWGWSRLHCNSIFDMGDVAGDAFVQDEYARGPVWQFDIQGGATLPKVKLGARYRTVFSIQDQYSYSTNAAATGPGSKLTGSWSKSEWTKTSSEHIARIYGNYNLYSNERIRYNTLLFLGYDGKKTKNSLSSNVNVDRNWRELFHNIVIEVNPNMNINFGMPMFFIDAALLLEYSYARFNNRYQRYVNGGLTDSYWQTSTGARDEYENESFSYANENFFDIGFDMNASFPVYKDNKRAAGLSLILFANNKFSKFTKYYGNYPGNSTDFKTDTLRIIRKKETWFNSTWVLNVRQAPWTFQVDLSQPLLYKLVWKTKVIDKKTKDIFWSWMKEMPYAAQQGLSIGFFAAYDLKSGLKK